MAKYHALNPQLQNFSVTNTIVPLINQYTAVSVPLNITPSPTSAPKLGDANGDTRVDGIDYVIWLNHYGQSASGPQNGDFDSNNRVDGVDYVIWLNHYGT